MNFNKVCDTARLTLEIQGSPITVALDYITQAAGVVSIYFKAILSGAEEIILNDIVTAHVNIPLVENEVKNVIVNSLPDPQPFATPSYRTKRNATASLVSVVPSNMSVIDFIMPFERYVTGGAIIIKNAEIGDYITASVFDGASIVPEAYRAALCENWPVIAEYIEKEWIKIGNGSYTFHEINTYPLNAKITQGLYLRVNYHACAEGMNRIVACNYNLTKKL